MKTSCVQNLPGEPLIVIRKWQVEICSGNHCAAALLSFFIYWHDIKLEMAAKDERANLLQWHTIKDLRDGMLGLFSDESIRKGRKLLGELGLITEHKNPDPNEAYDRTTFFLLNSEKLNAFLALSPKNTILDPSKTGDVAPKIADVTPKTSDHSSTETSSETTQSNEGLRPPSPKMTNGESKEPLPKEATFWNENCGSLSKVISNGTSRARHLSARRHDPFWVENFEAAVKRVAASKFCNGQGSNGWCATFDWLVERPDAVLKVMEGKYDDRANGAAQNQVPLGQRIKIVQEAIDQHPANRESVYHNERMCTPEKRQELKELIHNLANLKRTVIQA